MVGKEVGGEMVREEGGRVKRRRGNERGGEDRWLTRRN